MPSAGNFKAEISGPYPVWIGLTYEDGRQIRFHHSELADLKHVVDRAMVEARLKLGKDAAEV